MTQLKRAIAAGRTRPVGEPVVPAADATLAYLHARGLTIEPQGLSSLLEEALGEMRRTLFPSDPAADLPAEETAALRRGGFELMPGKRENANALARTAADYAALLATSLTVNRAAQTLELDPSRIRQLLAARKLYGFQIKGVWSIPMFQFDGPRLLPGLEEVLPSLPRDLHPVAVYRWFTIPNPDLSPEDLDRDLSPRDWLLAGYAPKVVTQLGTDLDNL
jgi:hypothetical protein